MFPYFGQWLWLSWYIGCFQHQRFYGSNTNIGKITPTKCIYRKDEIKEKDARNGPSLKKYVCPFSALLYWHNTGVQFALFRFKYGCGEPLSDEQLEDVETSMSIWPF